MGRCWVCIAEPARRIARGQGGCALVHQCCQERGKEVDLHLLAGPSVIVYRQRHQDHRQGILPGEDVNQGNPNLAGFSFRVAGDTHQTAERLHEQVMAGQICAGAGYCTSAANLYLGGSIGERGLAGIARYVSGRLPESPDMWAGV